MAKKIIVDLKLTMVIMRFFKISFLALGVLHVVFLPSATMAATLENSGDKAIVVVVAEGAGRRGYAVDTKQTITFCLKGCFITLANGDRYVLAGNEVVEITGNRFLFH